MEGQEYLNQISAKSKPPKRAGSGLLSSKFFIVGAVGVAVLLVIIILGAVLGGKDSEKDLSIKFKLHLDNTASAIQTYQPSVRSSDLRSSSASLYGILTNTSRDLTNYLVEKYKFKDKDVDKKIVEAATLEKDGLESELFEAKINGILDRIFAHKMSYEITVLMSEENKLINTTKNETLKENLLTSYRSLENLYESFNDYSETK